MGEHVSLTPDLILQIQLPSNANVTVIKDGSKHTEQNSQSLEVSPTEPGIYRVEVFKEEVPWIFSNPIYIEP